jgi:hypothetical protein
MKRDYITQLWEAAEEYLYLTLYGGGIMPLNDAAEKLRALLKKCPKCQGEVSRKGGHGAWCQNPECKWGWETELDGSPLTAGGL